MGYNLGFSNHAYFYLSHKVKGIKLIPEPIEWDRGSVNQKKDKKTKINEISIGANYEYYGVSKDFILDVIYKYGVKEDVTLHYYVKKSNGIKSLKFSGLLDLSSYEIEDGKLKVKFDKNSLRKTLKANQSKKIELERSTALTGVEVSSFGYEHLNIESKGLFLESYWNKEYSGYIDTEVYHGNEGFKPNRDRSFVLTAPLNLIHNGHTDDAEDSVLFQKKYSSEIADSGLFFVESETDRTIDLNIDISMSVHHVSGDRYVKQNFALEIWIFDKGVSDPSRKLSLYTLSKTSSFSVKTINVNKFYSLDIKKGQSMSVVFWHNTELNPALSYPAYKTTRVYFNGTSVKINERNKERDRIRRVFGVYEFGERLVELITGNKNLFHSDELKNGEFKDLKLTSGLYIRGFYGENYIEEGEDIDDESDINDTKRISASLKDYSSYLMKLGIVPVYKKIDKIEKICFEHISESFIKKEFIRLKPQGFNFKKSLAKDDVFSSIKIGSKFADTEDSEAIYEGEYGLSEYNAMTHWNTEHLKLDNEFSIVTNFREDPIGVTLALKKPIEINTSEDTSFDSSIFVFDCINESGVTRIRKWRDDYIKTPENIYDPESAYNLRLTPRSVLNRWLFLLSTDLKSDISVLNSTGNSSLRLTTAEGVFQENETVSPKNTILSGEKLEFEYPLDTNISEALLDQTVVGSSVFPNSSGLIRAYDEDGNITIGWLKSLKEDETIKFELNIAK